MDARDELQTVDSIGAEGPITPPKPRTPRDPERTKLVLAYVIAVAAIAAATFGGISAWELHEARTMDHDLYCASYAIDYETGKPASYDDLDGGSKAVVDALGCDIPRD